MTIVRLFDLCHARAGDKGDDALLVLIPYQPSDFPTLARLMTPAILARHFRVASEDVSIIPAPQLASLVIAVRGRLHGGVTRSLTIDPHGKTMSGHLLDLLVEWRESPGDNARGPSGPGDRSEFGQ